MKIRLGNDFAHVWVVERLGEPENLDAARDIEMYLRSANGSVPIAFAVQDGNKIRTQFTAANVPAIGDYSLLLTYIGSDGNRHTLDLDAFTIVSSSAKADQVDEFTSTSDVAIGLRGADAFQVWQSQSGNEGKTYEEYIAYLREPMTLAIEDGNDTAAEWAIAEAERVANELIREENEEDRNAAELIREEVKEATIIAKNEAIQATSDANDAASLANSKADLANDAATNANSKAGLADIAATNANSKADLAVTATTNANDAADLANSKAGIAQTAADNANAKAILADTAATNANTVATNVANAEAARVLAGSEVKTNKTSDIESNKTSVDKYPTTKGVVDYVKDYQISSDVVLAASATPLYEVSSISNTYDDATNLFTENVKRVFVSGTTFLSLYTASPLFDSAIILLPDAKAGTGAIIGYTKVYDKNGNIITEGINSGAVSGTDFGHVLTSAKYVWLKFAKGRFATIADARTELGTITIRYRLNVPVTTTVAIDGFTIDISTAANAYINVLEGRNKITFANVPQVSNKLISISILIDYAENGTLLYPAGTAWVNGTEPIYEKGYKYILILNSYDKGATWLATQIGKW